MQRAQPEVHGIHARDAMPMWLSHMQDAQTPASAVGYYTPLVVQVVDQILGSNTHHAFSIRTRTRHAHTHSPTDTHTRAHAHTSKKVHTFWNTTPPPPTPTLTSFGRHRRNKTRVLRCCQDYVDLHLTPLANSRVEFKEAPRPGEVHRVAPVSPGMR
jgi:hypothetical protein